LAAELTRLAASRDGGGPPGPGPEPEQWLAEKQVTEGFGLTAEWLEDHQADLRAHKIISKPSRKVRLYHARRLVRYLEARCHS
jgi:hypothetical protein